MRRALQVVFDVILSVLAGWLLCFLMVRGYRRERPWVGGWRALLFATGLGKEPAGYALSRQVRRALKRKHRG